MRRIKCMGMTVAVCAAILTAAEVASPEEFVVNVENGERPVAVLDDFPLVPRAYKTPVARLVRAGIPERYGHEEWAAVVLTHEFHQHVGMYTVLGAKMAVRARQILDAPMRAVHVTAETGRKEPLSCVADGFQTALGSTFGQNLIEAPETDNPIVAATFEYKGRKVRLRLRDEYAAKITDLIREARERHGDLTPEYFKAVETATYRVWAEFDRGEIFSDEETLSPCR